MTISSLLRIEPKLFQEIDSRGAIHTSTDWQVSWAVNGVFRITWISISDMSSLVDFAMPHLQHGLLGSALSDLAAQSKDLINQPRQLLRAIVILSFPVVMYHANTRWRCKQHTFESTVIPYSDAHSSVLIRDAVKPTRVSDANSGLLVQMVSVDSNLSTLPFNCDATLTSPTHSFPQSQSKRYQYMLPLTLSLPVRLRRESQHQLKVLQPMVDPCLQSINEVLARWGVPFLNRAQAPPCAGCQDEMAFLYELHERGHVFTSLIVPLQQALHDMEIPVYQLPCTLEAPYCTVLWAPTISFGLDSTRPVNGWKEVQDETIPGGGYDVAIFVEMQTLNRAADDSKPMLIATDSKIACLCCPVGWIDQECVFTMDKAQPPLLKRDSLVARALLTRLPASSLHLLARVRVEVQSTLAMLVASLQRSRQRGSVHTSNRLTKLYSNSALSTNNIRTQSALFETMYAGTNDKFQFERDGSHLFFTLNTKELILVGWALSLYGRPSRLTSRTSQRETGRRKRSQRETGRQSRSGVAGTIGDHTDTNRFQSKYNIRRAILERRRLSKVKQVEGVAQAEARYNGIVIQQPGLDGLQRLVQGLTNYNNDRLKARVYFPLLQYLCYSFYTMSLGFYEHKFCPFELAKLQATDQVSTHPQLSHKHLGYLPAYLEFDYKQTGYLLLVGPPEAGKSYLATSLAARIGRPFIWMSMKTLIDSNITLNRKWFKSRRRWPGCNKFNPTKTSWNPSTNYTVVRTLVKCFFLFHLIKRLSPCVVCMPDLSHLSTIFRSDQSFFEGKMLLHNLLRTINSNLSTDWQQTLFVASSSKVTTLDPAWLSPYRFRDLIHVRMLDKMQRERSVAILLRAKTLCLAKDNVRNDIGNRTSSYDWIDLIGLTNEAHLISITQRTCSISPTTMGLALFRLESGVIQFDIHSQYLHHQDASQLSLYGTRIYEDLFLQQREELAWYKLGKAVAQGVFVNSNIEFAFCYAHSPKDRFASIYKPYFQSTSTEPTVGELTMLPYILSCLAGSAARDAWLSSETRAGKYVLGGGNIQASDDLELVSALFETLSHQIARPSIHTESNVELYNSPQSRATNKSSISSLFTEAMHSEVYDTRTFTHNSYDKSLFGFYCNAKTQRLSIYRSTLCQLETQMNSRLAHNGMLLTQISQCHTLYHNHKAQGLQLRHTHRSSPSTAYQQHKQVFGSAEHWMQYGTPMHSVFFLSGRPVIDFVECSYSRRRLFSYQEVPINQDGLIGLIGVYNEIQQQKAERRIISISQQRNSEIEIDSILEQQARLLKTKEQEVVDGLFNQFSGFHFFENFECLVHKNTKATQLQLADPFKRLSSYYFVMKGLNDPAAHFYWSRQTQAMACSEMFFYGTLIESYSYLSRFFLFHTAVLKQLMQLFSQKNALFSEELRVQMSLAH